MVNNNRLFEGLFLLSLLVCGCKEVTYSRDTEMTEAQRNASNVLLIGEGIVDILSDVLYINKCISDYPTCELNEHLRDLYFPDAVIESENQSIMVDRQRGMQFLISTGGTALDSEDVSWTIVASIVKPWGNYSPECFEFVVSRNTNSYALTGNGLFNRLFQKGYYYTEFELSFTTGVILIPYYDPVEWTSVIDREVPVFTFDGSISSFFGDNGKIGEDGLRYDMTLHGLKGYDHKEYVGSDPIYDGTTYFESGAINCLVSTKEYTNKNLIINVKNERNWQLTFDGEMESYRPNTMPIRF